MESLRLLKTYRGYKAGEVIQATAGLAEHLVQHGIATKDHQRALPLPETAERAVASPAAAQAVETR